MKPVYPVLLTLALLTMPARSEEPEKELKISKAEQKLIDLVNESRKEQNLKPLVPDATLFKVARAHSANMAKQEKMAHELDGKNPAQRVKEAGYRYRSTGENIAAGDPRWPLTGAHKAWMNSKPHKQNILSKSYTEIGIGIATSKKGEKFYTQVFGRKLKR